MIQDPKAWPSFSTELGEVALLQWIWLGIMDMVAKYIPRHTTMNMVGYGWMDQKMNYSLRLQGYYIDDSGSESMTEFLHGARRGSIASEKIFRLQDFHIPREQNRTADGLARIADTFHHSLVFLGYSIPVWISRPFLV
ncbi:hypothetical protein DY000_02061569 [Brassica cretica]|uniref:RNase H type-1 domain-containing protein n=1 Tax=Brassica cretica TaxID=69181 RepID=A0ABQ7ASE7_BRACR|nr:hypothetical protein DY000_02061569 [Brassica cretica]